jgi:hypothetical protein
MVNIDDFYNNFNQYYQSNLKKFHKERRPPTFALCGVLQRQLMFWILFCIALVLIIISFYGLVPTPGDISPHHIILLFISIILAILAWKSLEPDLRQTEKEIIYFREKQYIIALERSLIEGKLYSLEGIEHVIARAQRKIEYIKDNSIKHLFGWLGTVLLAVIISISANIVYNNIIRSEDNIPYNYIIVLIVDILTCLTAIRTLFRGIVVQSENKACKLQYFIEVLLYVKINVKSGTSLYQIGES